MFLRDFLKDPVSIGAISQSSNTLARAMISNLVIEPGDCVVELGPGTGVFTRQIREKTNAYLGIERNPRFTQLLDRRFPELNFVNGRAEDGLYHYEEIGLPPPKVIVCGLPLAIWSAELQDPIINVVDSLMTPGCIFRTFQYAHSFAFPLAIRFRSKMNVLCGRCRRSPLVLRNLPPAFILTWSR
jgi:phospholipid N-methyltransferase